MFVKHHMFNLVSWHCSIISVVKSFLRTLNWMMSNPWHFQEALDQSFVPFDLCAGWLLQGGTNIFMCRNQMNHKTQSNSHGMTWKKSPKGFTHASQTWLPEGEVSNTHGGPWLWCVVLCWGEYLLVPSSYRSGLLSPCLASEWLCIWLGVSGTRPFDSGRNFRTAKVGLLVEF